MNFSQREKMILQNISKNYPHFVSIEDLSATLDVSKRTIQRDLKQLEISLLPYEVKVVKKHNKGITLKHKHLLQVIEDILMSDNIDLNQIGRVIAIYQEFMFNDDFSTSNYLSEKHQVSIYTINQDVDLLADMLSNTNVKINKKPGVGLELEGSEKDKRNGFAYLMSYYFQQESSFSIETSEFQLFELQSNENKLMKSTQRILFQEVKKFPFSFTDNSLHDLWMYLVISISRQDNHPVEPTAQVNDIHQEVSKSIFDRLGFELNFKYQNNEINYYASILRSGKRVNEIIDIQTDNLVNLAKELITYVSESTGYYIDQSPQFLYGLITHLRPLINRLQEGVFVGNPIKEQIKEDYPKLFLSIKHYFNEHVLLNVNDDEIGFLTLHFGVNIDTLKSVPNVRTLVICSSGIATSRMLTNRLLEAFPQMTIIEQSSLLELDQISVDEYDLIISTVKLNNPRFEYIHVNPLLDELDYKHIEEKVNNLLLEPRTIKPVEIKTEDLNEKLDKVDQVTQISRELINNFKVIKTNHLSYTSFVSDLEFSDTIKEDLIKKQNKFGFALPDTNIALVHTRHQDVPQVIVHIYQNRSDIVLKGMANKNEKIDTIVLLLTPLELTNEQLEVISFVSISLLEKKYLQLYSKESEDAITEFIKRQLVNSLNNTITKIWR
jgi:mannitol operon transcriptional antiterminator